MQTNADNKKTGTTSTTSTGGASQGKPAASSAPAASNGIIGAASPSSAVPPAAGATSGGDAPAGGSDPGPSDAAETSDKDPLLMFVVVGEVKEFKNRTEAEKYLNGPNAPSSFTVIRGRRLVSKQLISLRE